MVPAAAYEKLKDVARQRDLIGYRELAPFADVDPNSEFAGPLVGWVLDQINRQEHAAGRPLMSAIVVSKDTMRPGRGFYTCAKDLGAYSGGDDEGYWVGELRRVYDFWAKER